LVQIILANGLVYLLSTLHNSYFYLSFFFFSIELWNKSVTKKKNYGIKVEIFSKSYKSSRF
jgi:hypothetical protein